MVHFSPTGLLVVTRANVVRSAFIAGLLNDGALRNEGLTDSPLGPDHFADDLVYRYFTSVFKPAVAMIKRAPSRRACTQTGEYGVLRDCEGIGTRPLFAHWLNHCRIAGWSPGGEGGLNDPF